MGYPVILVEICHLCDSDDGAGAMLKDIYSVRRKCVVTKNVPVTSIAKYAPPPMATRPCKSTTPASASAKTNPNGKGKEIEIDENGIREKNDIARRLQRHQQHLPPAPAKQLPQQTRLLRQLR
jgi:hypothetical protein